MTSSQHPDADRPSDSAHRDGHTSGDGATSTGGDDPNTGSFSGGIFDQGVPERVRFNFPPEAGNTLQLVVNGQLINLTRQ